MRLPIRLPIRGLVRRSEKVQHLHKELFRRITTLSKTGNQYYSFPEPYEIVGDFEIAFKAIQSSYGNTMYFSGGTGANGFELFMNGTGYISFRHQGKDPGGTIRITELNKIHAFRVVRKGTTVYLIIDDQVAFVTTISGDFSIWTFCSRVGSTAFGMDGVVFDIEIWTGGDRTTGENILSSDVDGDWSKTNYVENYSKILGPDILGSPTTVNPPWVDNGNSTYTIDGTQSEFESLFYFGALEEYSSYIFDVEISGYLSGSVRIFNTDTAGEYLSGDGGFSHLFESMANTSINIQADANFVGTVKFTLKKVDPKTPILTILNISRADVEEYAADKNTGKWVGQDVVTQEVWGNPAIAGSEWSFADDRWTLNGTGELSALALFLSGNQPNVMRVSGEVYSVTGAGLRATSSALPESLLSSEGKYSFDVSKDKAVSQLFKRASGVATGILGKPKIQALLEYNPALIDPPIFTEVVAQYDGWNGILASLVSDSAVSVYVWLSSLAMDPSDRQVIGGVGAEYFAKLSTPNDIRAFASLAGVLPGNYQGHIAIVDSYDNVTRSQKFTVSKPEYRGYMKFNTPAAQRIELARNIDVGNQFELEVYVYIPTGEVGTIVAGENYNNTTLAIDITSTSIRFFAYDNTGQVQSPIKSVGLEINGLYNRWIKVIAKLDTDVPYLEIDGLVASQTGVWSGNGGQPAKTNIRFFGMRRGNINCFGGFVANVILWINGDRHTGVLASKFMLDRILGGFILDDNSNFGGDVASNKNPLFHADIRSLLPHNSYEKLVRIENAAGLSWHDGQGVVLITNNVEYVCPRDGGTGELNLYNASGSTFDMANVTVREFGGEWGRAINLNDSDILMMKHSLSDSYLVSRYYPNCLEDSSNIAGGRWSQVQSLCSDLGDGVALVKHDSTAGRIATKVLSDLGEEGSEFTFSIQVKEFSGSGYFRPIVIDNLSGSASHVNCWIKTSDRTVGLSGTSGNGGLLGVDVEEADDGWMTVTLSGRIGGRSDVGLWLYITADDGSTNRSTSITQLWRRPQLNIGPVVLPYQETVGEAGFRLKK